MAIHIERPDGGAYCWPDKEFDEMTTVDEKATCRRCLYCKNGMHKSVKAKHKLVMERQTNKYTKKFVSDRIKRNFEV